MERHGKLVLLLIVLAAIAVGGWLAFGGAGAGGGTPMDAPVAGASEQPTGAMVAAMSGQGKAGTEAAGPERQTVAVAGARPQDDPEVVAALAKFTGRVVRHDGKPVAECQVRLFRVDPQVFFLPDVSLLSEPIADVPDLMAGTTATGEDGRFELAGVWPRSIYLLKADAAGPNPTLRFADRTPGPGETVDLGDIALKDGAVVTGVVVDESGDPVAGALVRAADLPAMVTQFVPIEQFDPEGWLIISGKAEEQAVIELPGWMKKLWQELPVPSTLSGADGRFRLEGIEPGVNLVAAVKSGFLAATQKNVKLDAGQTRDLGRLVLGEGETASGKVVDGQGKPVAGVQVVVGTRLNMPPVAFGRAAGTSDDRGAFTCNGLGTGDVVAAARRAAGDPWVIAPAQSINKSLLVTLPSRHVLTVRLASDAGLAVESPRLRLVSFGGATGESELPVFHTLGLARAVSLPARQRVLEDGRIQLVDLDAAKYVLMASAAGHGPAMQNIELASDQEVELRLPREQTVDVVVLDGKDAPIRNAAVYVEMRGKGRETVPVHAGYTSAEGKVRVREANRDSAVIEASHPRYGVVATRVDLPASGPVTLRLLDPGTIEGEASEGGRAVPLGKYVVVAERAHERPSGPVSGMPAMTAIDADGKFALRGLQPGQWRVTLVKSFQAVRSFGSLMEMAMVSFGSELPTATVDLGAGQTAQVRLDTSAERVVEGPSARISGSVFVDGRPGDGMTVYGWNDRPISTVVDSGGQFDLGQVKEGSVHLRVSDSKGDGFRSFNEALWSRQVEVKGGNDVTLQIEISTGALVGTVLDLEGRPAAGVPVRAQGVTSGTGEGEAYGSGSTISDSEGRFEFERIAAGKYEIQTDGDERGRGEATVTVATGSRVEVRVQLLRTYRVKGRLDRKLLPLKEEQRWVYVAFEEEQDGKTPGRGRFRRTGGALGQEDDNFTVDGVLPGRYRVHIYGGMEGQWVHDGVVEVHRDMELIVQPVEVKPKEAPPKAVEAGTPKNG